MLDGSAAACLQRSKEALSAAEFDHIQAVQARLAALSEEEERYRAVMLRPVVVDSPLGLFCFNKSRHYPPAF